MSDIIMWYIVVFIKVMRYLVSTGAGLSLVESGRELV